MKLINFGFLFIQWKGKIVNEKFDKIDNQNNCLPFKFIKFL